MATWTLLNGWQAVLNVGNQLKFSAYRVTGATFTDDSILVGTTPNATTTSIVDNEELPNAVQFTYLVKANLNAIDDCNAAGADCTAPTNTATITAVNSAPVAVNDLNNTLYVTVRNTTVPLNINATQGVLANDTDVDSPHSSLKVVLTATVPPANGTLTLNADGSFSYMPRRNWDGTDTFKYKVDNGTWSRDSSVTMSPISNEATVNIVVMKK